MAEWTAISGGSFDYVQTSAPSGAEAGETWLDTGVNPPEEFVYNGTSWVKTAAGNSIEQNLDVPVSEAKGGIDWKSKTYESKTVSTDNGLSVSGSGYLLYVGLEQGPGVAVNGIVNIDNGSLNFRIPLSGQGGGAVSVFSGPPMRFESSLSISFFSTSNLDTSVVYILD